MNTLPTIVFMGTPDFAKVILQTLQEQRFPVLAVFAQPDKPVGRGHNLESPPVAQFAKAQGLTLFQPQKIRDAGVLTTLQSLQPDFLIVAAYGKILPETVLRVARRDCLNVHASLLPQYRGAAPIQQALLDDQKETGVAIMRLVAELDAGPVFAQRALAIGDDDTAITLTDKLARLGADTLCDALPRIFKGELKPEPQDEARVSYAGKITKERAVIDWHNPARAIFNQIRALQPWPVAETRLQQKRVRCFAATALASHTPKRPGEIVHIAPAGVTVATGFGDLLLRECQAEGKKRLRAFDAANGLRWQVGDVFG